MPRHTRQGRSNPRAASAAEEILLGYTAANRKRLVTEAAESRSPYSDHQIAEWAFRYWLNCDNLGPCADPARCAEAAVEVAQAIDLQWEGEIVVAFEANAHKPLDYSTLSMSKELWGGWLARLDAAGI